MKKNRWILAAALAAGIALSGCAGQREQTAAGEGAKASGQEDGEQTEILVAAAASLKNACEEELIPMFQEEHPEIRVTGTYDSSGKLQAQIEEGLEADVFMSAAVTQMNALDEEGLIREGSIVNLLENKIVLITPTGIESTVTSFEEIGNAASIALGDPESVPVGQYAQEALTSLGIWDEVLAKSSLGTNVTEVLNWVAEGSAQAGIVYATDAATTDNVKVIAQAPEGSLAEPAIYPVGLVSASAHQEEAQAFLDFLQSDEAMAVFEAYGFTSHAVSE